MPAKMIVGLVEKVKLIGGKRSVKTLAKLDTGAKWSSIDRKLAKMIGAKTVKIKKVKSSLGKQKRALVEFTIVIHNRKMKIKATVADRSKMAYLVLLGRNVMFKNFVVDIERSHLSTKEKDVKSFLKNDLKKVERLKKILYGG